MIPRNLEQIQSYLLDGQLSVEELVLNYLANIESHLDFNAYVEVFKDEAITQAKALDKRIKEDKGALGSLFGMVVSIKDNLCYKEHEVTASSKMLTAYVSPYSSTVVERLLDADAIIIGRTNCDEFSMGSTNETSVYGPTFNSKDKALVPGGSSGGAAVALAKDTCLVAIGSDTGGSIRQPAAFNGVIGYKPSYGLVSRWGLIAYGSSFDQVGTLSHCVQDSAKVLSVISGPDDYDSTLVPDAPPNFNTLKLDLKKLKVGFVENMFNHEKLKDQVKLSSNSFLQNLENHDVDIEALHFSFTDLLVPTYYVLCTAEASSNLSRFDGIRFGHRSTVETEDYREMIRQSRTEGFGFEVKKRIMLGTYVLSEGYYDAYFKKAQQVRNMIKDEMETAFEKYDFIIMPTTTDVAWSLGEAKNDPLEMYLSDVFTVLANLCGLPAISLPIENKKGHLPLGIQLISRHNKDKSLLAFAKEIINLA